MFYFKKLTINDVTTRGLILSLLNADLSENRSIGDLIVSGRLFGIEEATLRMAVTRLVKDDFIESPSRGIYKIGPKAKALNEEIRGWRSAQNKKRSWRGDWIVVHAAHLGRTDRKSLRARERALRFYGFMTLDNSLSIRPNNLKVSLTQLQQRLVDLGLEKKSVILIADDYLDDTRREWDTLWSSEELECNYKAALREMERSRRILLKMEPDEAARETLLVGQSVIQAINLDPLLPEEIVNTDLFNEVIERMIEYNKIGVRYWIDFYKKQSV
ncbi:MAG: hypothetical protein AAF720_04175 [Pseudomonadota bacterium]